MKQKLLMLLGILTVMLCGCAADNADYPEYFAPIVEELKTSAESAVPVMKTQWVESTDYYLDKYADKVYTCSIDNIKYSFDLSDVLENAKKWYWGTAGVFTNEENNLTYILLHDYNCFSYEDDPVPSAPQLLLIEFSTEESEEYQVYPYTVEPVTAFGWDVICYQLGETIYIAGEKELAAINLDTKEYHYCDEEYANAEKYVQDKFGQEPYHIYYFRAIQDQDGVIIYSADVDESFDELSPIGMIYAAYKDNKLIASMYVGLTSDGQADNIEVDMVGQDQ